MGAVMRMDGADSQPYAKDLTRQKLFWTEKGKTMYKSPIDIYYGQMETQLEGSVLRAVQKVGVNVDKEELIRALKYDRDQYDKGYSDGERDSMDSMIRCKNCKHCSNNTPDGLHWCDEHERGSLMDDDFCSYGERREGE